MKRLLFIASLAILAMSCEKTIVSNGVLTPIGFSTEVGKQTKAVVQKFGEGSYPTEQPFAVYAYGHHGNNNPDPIMKNVAIVPAGQTPAKWSADGSTKYYWPNDPRTTINFYAYSPATNTTNYDGQTLTNDQKLHFIEGGGVSHTENGGLILSGYKHKNMYVDFMVAAPVKGATYGDQDGNDNSTTTSVVPVSFAHQMTQINFKVQLVDQASYPNVDFTINSITLNAIYDQADYSFSGGQNKWIAAKDNNDIYYKRSYTVFPAVIDTDNAAPIQAAESAVVLHTDTRAANGNDPENPAKTSFNTIPVTMIPQAFVPSTKDNNGNITEFGHSFTINYDINGVGVADENVVKTFDLPVRSNTTDYTWTPNKKITYVLTISLKEILFDPQVQTWDPSVEENFDI